MSTQSTYPPYVVVFDGTAILFRAFYGVGPMTSPDGHEMGALYGMIQMLQELLWRFQTPHVAVVFDVSRETFRRELDPRYKANRKPAPEELQPQIPLAHRLVELLGLPMYAQKGYEADDLMATFAHLSKQAEAGCTLVSVDKDLCQLVNDALPPTQLVDPYRAVLYDERGVIQRMGVPPQYIIDFQALVGDSADNVPGVAGVGPKTAVALIERYGTLESIYTQLDDVHTLSVRGAKKLAEKLSKHQDDAFLSKQLVTLRHDVPISVTSDTLLTDVVWKGPQAGIEDFFEQLGLYYPAGRWTRLADR